MVIILMSLRLIVITISWAIIRTSSVTMLIILLGNMVCHLYT